MLGMGWKDLFALLELTAFIIIMGAVAIAPVFLPAPNKDYRDGAHSKQ
jgi:hypothetical protein